MRKQIGVYAILLMIMACSCKKERSEPKGSPIDLTGIDAIFQEDIAYDNKPRTQFDIFTPTSTTPTPLVIYIHGGGFKSGDKDFAYSVQKDGRWNFPYDIRTFLSKKIAFASIRYTLFDNNETEGVLKPMNDVKRALQYIRAHATEYNIDKEYIVLTGNSAGGGTSLWIGFSDDMKDESNTDPVLRESTRVKGIAVRNTQSTYDLQKWETEVFVDFGYDLSAQVTSNSEFEKSVNQVYGISSFSQFDSPETIQYRGRVDMLALMDKDDPELWVDNTLFENTDPNGDKNIMNHHPFHARELRERANTVGIPNMAYYGIPLLYGNPSGESWADFCIRKLNK